MSLKQTIESGVQNLCISTYLNFSLPQFGFITIAREALATVVIRNKHDATSLSVTNQLM